LHRVVAMVKSEAGKPAGCACWFNLTAVGKQSIIKRTYVVWYG
jgi:hypothetical protein